MSNHTTNIKGEMEEALGLLGRAIQEKIPADKIDLMRLKARLEKKIEQLEELMKEQKDERIARDIPDVMRVRYLAQVLAMEGKYEFTIKELIERLSKWISKKKTITLVSDETCDACHRSTLLSTSVALCHDCPIKEPSKRTLWWRRTKNRIKKWIW